MNISRLQELKILKALVVKENQYVAPDQQLIEKILKRIDELEAASQARSTQ